MIQDIIKKTSKVLVDNSPAILTAMGVVGAVGSAVLATEATVKATRWMDRNHPFPDHDDLMVRIKYRVQETWKYYVPTAGCVIFTVACIVSANRVGTRRAAVLASAYSLSEKAFAEYKDKVIEQIGEGKEQKVRDEIVKDRMEKDPASAKEVYITGNGDILCYETLTGRYFQSSMETLRKAQNDINSMILKDMYASQNEFYNLINLTATGMGEELGWNTDNMMELQFSSVLSDDGRPCLAIGYQTTPIRDYYKLG